MVKVKIGYEVTKRTCMEVEVTEEQLEALKDGKNPFAKELYEDALKNGDMEIDYSVYDQSGNEITAWSL